MVFVDTGAWFARYVPSDPNHVRVKGWLDANTEPLLTTDYCVDETLTLLVVRGRHRRALEAGRALIEENVAQLHFLKPDEIRLAWILFLGVLPTVEASRIAPARLSSMSWESSKPLPWTLTSSSSE